MPSLGLGVQVRAETCGDSASSILTMPARRLEADTSSAAQQFGAFCPGLGKMIVCKVGGSEGQGPLRIPRISGLWTKGHLGSDNFANLTTTVLLS